MVFVPRTGSPLCHNFMWAMTSWFCWICAIFWKPTWSLNPVSGLPPLEADRPEHARAGAAREEEEDEHRHRDRNGRDETGQAAHRAAEVALVLTERVGADPLLRKGHRGLAASVSTFRWNSRQQ